MLLVLDNRYDMWKEAETSRAGQGYTQRAHVTRSSVVGAMMAFDGSTNSSKRLEKTITSSTPRKYT